MTAHPREEHDHIVSPVIYLIVLAALMVLLCLTVTAAFVDLDKIVSGGKHQGTVYYNMAVAILIAMCKAALVILFFMHIKYGSRLAWAFAAAGFVWLGIMMTLSLSDYFTRNYPPSSPRSPQQYPSPNLMRPEPRPNPEVPGANAAPMRPVPSMPHSFWTTDTT
jgi:cytochrome c oxidase subunit IV